MVPNRLLDHLQPFLGKTIFWSGAKQRISFIDNQNARIWALGFLAWWQLKSHALYYNLS